MKLRIRHIPFKGSELKIYLLERRSWFWWVLVEDFYGHDALDRALAYAQALLHSEIHEVK